MQLENQSLWQRLNSFGNLYSLFDGYPLTRSKIYSDHRKLDRTGFVTS